MPVAFAPLMAETAHTNVTTMKIMQPTFAPEPHEKPGLTSISTPEVLALLGTM